MLHNDYIARIADAMDQPASRFAVVRSTFTARPGTPPFTYIDDWFKDLLPPVAVAQVPAPPALYAAAYWLDFLIVRISNEITLPAEEYEICQPLASSPPNSPAFGYLDNWFNPYLPTPAPSLPLPLVASARWDFLGHGIELDGNIRP